MPCSPFSPPNRTALLLSMEVREKPAHGGGLSPVMSGEIQAPVVWRVVIYFLRVLMFEILAGWHKNHKGLYAQTKFYYLVVFLRLS